jgi:Ca2+ transporting ATPase
VNSSALIDPEEKGSSTEIALLRYCKKMGAGCEEYRNKYPTLLRIPFSSSRKRMSVIIDYKDDKHLFIKGAS